MMTPKIPEHVPADLVHPFNVFEIPLNEDIFEHMATLHEDKPDIFYNPVPLLDRSFQRGAWMITKYDHAQEILTNYEDFSSVGISGFAELIDLGYDLMIPIDVDPPVHTQARGVIREFFSPKFVARLEEDIRDLARSLVDKAVRQGEVEFVRDIAWIYPTQMFLLMMGMPMEEYEQFLTWEQDLLVPDPNNIDKTRQSVLAILDRVQQGFEERRQNPADDLLTVLVQAEDISDEIRTGLGFNLFVGGLDTVLNQLTWIFRYLAQNEAIRHDLRGNPDRIATALEELMRLHSVLTTRRFATRDLEFHGTQIKKGDSLEIPFAAVNQDPDFRKNPRQAILDAKPNRHMGFSHGPHICIGMHLARTELRLMVDEWLKQIPDFRVKEGTTLTFHPGIYGLNELPLVWD